MKFDYERYYTAPNFIVETGSFDIRYSHIKDKFRLEGEILDVGGGDGLFLEWFDKKGTVMDISRTGLSKARKKGFRTAWGNAERKFPFRNDTFDTVISFNTMEHLDHPKVYLSEMRRVMKHGGIMYLGVPNMVADGVFHKRRWHPKEVIDACHASGFKILNVYRTPACIEGKPFLHFMDLDKRKASIHVITWGARKFPFRFKHWLAHHWDAMTMVTIVEATK